MSTNFEMVNEYKGYLNKPDITNIPPGYLIRGSKNTLTSEKNRVSIRKGYTVDGPASSAIGGIKGSHDWETGTGESRHMRSSQALKSLQFRYVDLAGSVTWQNLMTNVNPNFHFALDEWWDVSQLIATSLFVNGENKLYEWSGAVTEVASVTGTTITKQGLYVKNTIAFVNSNPDTITDSANGFVTAGFKQGDSITVTGSVANDGTYKIASVLPGTITLALNETLVAGAAGPSVTLSTTGSWIEQGFYTAGTKNAFIEVLDYTGLAGDTVSITVNGVVTVLTEGVDWTAAVSNEDTADSLASAIDGVTNVEAAVDTSALNFIVINQKTENDVINNLISSASVADLEITPKVFATSGQVILGGVTFTYTGGEGTNTLTGVTPNPTAQFTAPGQVTYQAVKTLDNFTDLKSIPSSNSNDIVEVLDNQVYLASEDNRFVYVSHIDNYTDFSFSTPRVVGEGARLTLGGQTVAMVPFEGVMHISAGRDNWYEVVFQKSSDLKDESLEIQQIKTNPGEGAFGRSSVATTKNGLIYISREPSMNTLSRVSDVLTNQVENYSDPIKIDFDSLDFTGVSLTYFKYNIYIAVPAEDLVYIYNIAEKYWEPPQSMPIARFAIIDGELYGHSSRTPETYKLFTGARDRVVPGSLTITGTAIDAAAVFSYQWFGNRAASKGFNEWYTEGYMSRNTDLDITFLYEIDGCEAIIKDVIPGNVDEIFCFLPSNGPLGKKPLGKGGLGRGIGLISEVDLPKFRAINVPINIAFHEMTVVYSSNELDFSWELLAFGPAVQKLDLDNVEIKL